MLNEAQDKSHDLEDEVTELRKQLDQDSKVRVQLKYQCSIAEIPQFLVRFCECVQMYIRLKSLPRVILTCCSFVFKFNFCKQPEAEQDGDSWNDSSDEDEAKHEKKISANEGKLIAVLRSQVLGLTRENDQLREKLQVSIRTTRQVELDFKVNHSFMSDVLL